MVTHFGALYRNVFLHIFTLRHDRYRDTIRFHSLALG